MDHTKRVANFIADTRYADIHGRALAAAKDAVLDAVGVALAGSQDPAGEIIGGLTRDEAAVEQAVVFGQGFRSSATAAALANGLAGHALDFDFSFTIGGQPMASLTAAAFATAEPRRASGAQLLEAWIVGYEVAGKIIKSMPAHTEGGWHSTGTVGSMGAAAVASRLLGLDAEQVSMALGLAASMSSGLSWNFGSMGKPLHAGLAARNGVMAARLAQRGFEANPRMLEGPRGYLQSYAEGDYDPTVLDTIGKSFEVENGVRYKAYPCGGLTHTAVDAMLALRKEHGITPDAIDHVDVGVTAGVAGRIIYRIPETALQGKFSIPYIIARAIMHGGLGNAQFTEEATRDPVALALAERITMRVDPELKDTGSVSRPSRVEVRLKDGRSFSCAVSSAKGSPDYPMTKEELRAKFASNAAEVLAPPRVAEAADMLTNLETVKDVTTLATLLMA